MEENLLIKIAADVSAAKEGLDELVKHADNAEHSLATIAEISAVAFAALSAEVYESVKAFAEAETANAALTQALQSQGIYTDDLKEKYHEYAESVSAATGVNVKSLTASQAVAQEWIGQIPITEELTAAIADLAQAKGISLAAAAEKVGRSIGTETNAFARMGLVMDATATHAERYTQVLTFLQGTVGGQAQAASETFAGTMKRLGTAFDEVQEKIGARFAPALQRVADLMIGFFDTLAGNDELMNFVIAIGEAGLVVAGLGVAIPAVVTAIGLFRTAMTLAGIATSATGLAVKTLVGATGIGLLVIVASELVAHWETVWPRIVSITQGAITALTGTFKGLGTILQGMMSFDSAKITQGITEVSNSIKEGFKIATETSKATTALAQTEVNQQDAIRGAAADKRHAAAAADQANRIALAKAQQELIRAEIDEESIAVIALKKEEIKALEALIKTHNIAEIALLKEKIAAIKSEEVKQEALEAQQDKEFDQRNLAAKKKFHLESLNDDNLAENKKQAVLQASIMTTQQAQQKAIDDEISAQINLHNAQLQEQVKYGTAYAAINAAMHSAEVQGAKTAFGELGALQSSKNAELKAIGKAAAVANVVIKTAESAMNIFAGFSTIPIIGPVLGVAGAAAAIAYGVEQEGNILGAAAGGLVSGGVPGKDSVPAMLSPGELVAPAKSFDEVVNSVAASRSGGATGSGAGGMAQIELTLKGQLMDFIDAQLVQRQRLNLTVRRG